LPTCVRLVIGLGKDGGNQPPRRIPSCPTERSSRSGMTLVELIVAFTILLILTSMAVPVARTNVRRIKERNLREALKEVRTAIDKYKDLADAGKLGIQKQDTYGYPETLQALVDGVKGSGQAADTKLKFLRRIPLDPMTNTREWGIRSMQDDPTSTGWGGQNVFDVYTKSMDKAADGTPYSEW
jgi:general secretion pathway protein G